MNNKTAKKPAKKFEHNLKSQLKLKKQSYKTGLIKVRERLTPGYRLVSNLTQSGLGEKVFNLTLKTLGRPYPLLLASITSLFGTAIVSYYAKTYGYRFNYMLVAYLFAVGYVLACLVELIVRSVKKLS